MEVFVADAVAPPDAVLRERIGGAPAYWSAADARLIVYAMDLTAVQRVESAMPTASRHRLSPLSECDGAGAGEAPTAHYIVWTDVDDGWWGELDAWYADEHLPGLASVPGAIRARRFRQGGSGPAHFACYDLTAPDVLGSPPWLAVRATPWSSRVRPHFCNTRRWMTRPLPLVPPERLP